MSVKQKSPSITVSLLFVVIACGLVFVGWYVWQQSNNKPGRVVDTFEACVSAGNPIMETYPEQCSANGKTFTNPKQGQSQ